MRRASRWRLPVAPDLLLAVAVGGALGTVARYELAQAIHVAPGTFPWPTFLANVSGAWVLGAVLAAIEGRRGRYRLVRPFAAAGVLAGYTTFSTLAVETVVLVKDGHVTLGIGYLLLSVAAGLAAAWAGWAAAHAARRARRAEAC